MNTLAQRVKDAITKLRYVAIILVVEENGNASLFSFSLRIKES